MIAVVALAGVPLLAACDVVKHPIATQRAGAVPDYFDANELDLTKLLPPPPANDSAATRADLDEMLKVQQTRTPEQGERARADAAANLYRLADALGNPPTFNAKNLPLTDALFRKVRASEIAVVGAAKKRYDRPRPFLLEPKLEPLIDKPHDGSYPSGHSSWARATALVLADIVPERRAQILARADEYAYNRVVVGVHYPSDVAAGKLAGTAIAAALFVSPSFRADLAAARTELRRALNLPASPTDLAAPTERVTLSDPASPNDRATPNDSANPNAGRANLNGAPATPSATGAPNDGDVVAPPTAHAAPPAKADSATPAASAAHRASPAQAASADRRASPVPAASAALRANHDQAANRARVASATPAANAGRRASGPTVSRASAHALANLRSTATSAAAAR
jgi:acid phosphatase (class A)